MSQVSPALRLSVGLSLQTRGHPGGGARCHHATPTLGLSGQWKTTHLTEAVHKAVSWPLSLITVGRAGSLGPLSDPRHPDSRARGC